MTRHTNAHATWTQPQKHSHANTTTRLSHKTQNAKHNLQRCVLEFGRKEVMLLWAGGLFALCVPAVFCTPSRPFTKGSTVRFRFPPDGLTVLDRWRKEGKVMPVLVLTARDAPVVDRSCQGPIAGRLFCSSLCLTLQRSATATPVILTARCTESRWCSSE